MALEVNSVEQFLAYAAVEASSTLYPLDLPSSPPPLVCARSASIHDLTCLGEQPQDAHAVKRRSGIHRIFLEKATTVLHGGFKLTRGDPRLVFEVESRAWSLAIDESKREWPDAAVKMRYGLLWTRKVGSRV